MRTGRGISPRSNTVPQREALKVCLYLGGQRPTQLLRAQVTDIDIDAGSIKPCAVAFERVIVDNDTYIRQFCTKFRDLCRVGFPSYGPIACFVVPDVVRSDTFRNEVILALVPNSLPAVEQVAQCSLL